MTIQDFPSRMDDPASHKLGTFSYLPPLSREQTGRQIEYILAQGWTCAIEHVEPARAGHTYWYMWKLPMFAETDPETVMAELDNCQRAHPHNHVRLVGYDRRRQTQGLTFVVHRAERT
jgi:ribulose-bisphosphate carboxylase small chain